jgi:hypothetical protein
MNRKHQAPLCKGVSLTSPEALPLLKEILGRDLLLRVRVTGRSMRPLLRGGDVVTLRRTGAAAVRPGDVVLVQKETGQLLLHRLVKKTTGHDGGIVLQTRGDALKGLDAPVGGKRLLGRAVMIETRGDGKKRRWDMESRHWKAINRALAAVGLAVSRAYGVAAALKGRLLGTNP